MTCIQCLYCAVAKQLCGEEKLYHFRVPYGSEPCLGKLGPHFHWMKLHSSFKSGFCQSQLKLNFVSALVLCVCTSSSLSLGLVLLSLLDALLTGRIQKVRLSKGLVLDFPGPLLLLWWCETYLKIFSVCFLLMSIFP